MFTALAVMQLAQAGKLDLSAPLGRYLQQCVFAPVRMTQTAMQPEDLTLPNRATAYTRVNGKLQAVTAEALRARGAASD